MANVLVSGGAGYIGSHVARQLAEHGHGVVVLDNLSCGFREAVQWGDLVVGSVGDVELVGETLDRHRIDSVMHFAAHTVVPESVADPLKYYGNNTCASRGLLEACVSREIPRFIFSSTAAVYGIPEGGVASEDTPTRPINPYGQSKLMTEWMLRDVAASTAMNYVALRYFNVAGCDPQGRIGQSTPGATLLIKVACEVAMGRRPELQVFGTDYDTPDGTGVRDFVHVEDLADAHVRALGHLESGGESTTLNCGYGHGYSVREVAKMVESVTGNALPCVDRPRRAGDPATLVARADRIRTTLGWEPRHEDLESIVATTLAWERKLSEGKGYGGV